MKCNVFAGCGTESAVFRLVYNRDELISPEMLTEVFMFLCSKLNIFI
jgi:hypothetical protein